LLQTRRIANTGAAPFEFQALQHTYHALDAAEGAEVTGLEGMDFFDKLDPSRTTGWPADKPVVIDQEFDGIFMRNKAGETRPDPIKLAGRSPGGKSITVQAWATTSTAGDAAGATEARLEMVVWNPWVEKSKTLRDLPDDGYKAFICLEPGRVAGHATLEAGHEFVIHQVVDYE
jgi:glucose-6-phosphate 1-epimerase